MLQNHLFVRGIVFFIVLLTAGTLFFALAEAADQDGDGLEDSWERANGLNDTNPNDGKNAISGLYGKDANADGVIDGQEQRVSEQYKSPLLDTFLVTLILAFALVFLIVGIFIAYYGAGQTRARGAIMALIGVIGLVAFGFTKILNGRLFGFLQWHLVNVTLAFLVALGAILGIIIAIAIAYLSVMH